MVTVMDGPQEFRTVREFAHILGMEYDGSYDGDTPLVVAESELYPILHAEINEVRVNGVLHLFIMPVEGFS